MTILGPTGQPMKPIRPEPAKDQPTEADLMFQLGLDLVLAYGEGVSESQGQQLAQMVRGVYDLLWGANCSVRVLDRIFPRMADVPTQGLVLALKRLAPENLPHSGLPAELRRRAIRDALRQRLVPLVSQLLAARARALEGHAVAAPEAPGSTSVGAPDALPPGPAGSSDAVRQ